jgi:hypothetical protein
MKACRRKKGPPVLDFQGYGPKPYPKHRRLETYPAASREGIQTVSEPVKLSSGDFDPKTRYRLVKYGAPA